MSTARPTLLFIGNYLKKAATHQASFEVSERLKQSGFSILRTAPFFNKWLRIGHMLGSILVRRNQFQIAHLDLFSGQAVIWAYFCSSLLRFMDRPYVVTLHGGGLPEHFNFKPALIRRILEGASAITSPSPYLRNVFQGAGFNVQLIPNPIGTKDYQFSNPTLKPIILWCRAFDPIYQPCLAVEAMAHVSKIFPDARLLMVGPVKNETSLQDTKQLIAAHHLEESVILVGGVPKRQVPKLFSQALIFLNTSRVDNTPVTLLEAMASELPVVSTEVGGIPYLIEHMKQGLLCPIDAQLLANAIVSLLNDKKLLRRMGKAARKKVVQWDWPIARKKWEQLFSKLGNSI